MSEPVAPTNFQFLKPQQVAELNGEKTSIERSLRGEGGAQLQDRGAAMKRGRAIDKMLTEEQAPELKPEQKDSWSKRGGELREKFTQGMCSGEEMRKAPPGAVGKHTRWEKHNKSAILEWKNIQRALNPGSDDPDVANIEQFRPHRTAHDLNMDNAQITGTTYSGISPTPQYLEGHDRTFGEKEEEEKPGPKQVAMACGCMKEPRGRKMHERQCPKCQRVLSGAVPGEAA